MTQKRLLPATCPMGLAGQVSLQDRCLSPSGALNATIAWIEGIVLESGLPKKTESSTCVEE